MLTTLITFILILGLLVLVHEIGHFIVARSFGVKCDEFGLGFPPRMIGIVKDPERPRVCRGRAEGSGLSGFLKKWRIVKARNKDEKGEEKEYPNTIYSLNWIPLGGFVKIKGEQGEDTQDEDSFACKKTWQRALIVLSGVVMNFLLAAVLFSIGFVSGIPQVLDKENQIRAAVRDEKIQILSVQKDSPADNVGLGPGDIIERIDGYAFERIEEVQSYIQKSESEELKLTIKRGGQKYEKVIRPERVNFENQEIKRAIGVVLAKTGIVSYPPFQAIWQGVVTTGHLMKLIITSFYQLFRDLIITHKVTVDLAGPVGIAVVTGQVVKLGFIYILQFAALLSINLGIINFFPFPALDGGRMIALGIEAIRQKRNNQRIEALIHNIGFGILMALVVLVTYRDIVRFGGNILEKVFG